MCEKFKLYSARARCIASCVKPNWFGRYDVDRFQVDHLFSIRSGFDNAVPLEVISNRNNMRLVPKWSNQRKGSRNSITIMELYQNYLPDEKLIKLAKGLETIEDVEQVLKFGLFAHHYFKAMLALVP